MKRKLQSYQYDLSNIPAEHVHIFERANAKMKEAYENPGKLVFDTAGNYYLAANDELLTISHNENGWMVVHVYAGHTDWYSDPYNSLKEIKEAYGVTRKPKATLTSPELPRDLTFENVGYYRMEHRIDGNSVYGHYHLASSPPQNERWITTEITREEYALCVHNIQLTTPEPTEADFDLYVIDTGHNSYDAYDAKTLAPFGKRTPHHKWQSLTGFRKCKWITEDEWSETIIERAKLCPGKLISIGKSQNLIYWSATLYNIREYEDGMWGVYEQDTSDCVWVDESLEKCVEWLNPAAS